MNIPTPLIIAYKFILNFIYSGLNKRSIIGLIFNFAINFSPVFLWLLIFKNANLIPDSIRPLIHVRFAKNFDEFTFAFSRYTSYISFLFILSGSYLLWFNHYKNLKDSIHQLFNSNTDLRTSLIKPLNTITAMPPILLALSWILLNLEHLIVYASTTYTFLDLTAWTSYVLFHFFNPLFTAIYLYVFQFPGALKTFSFCLGFQNILGVLTHLLFPNAPPWFIHLYSEDAAATYQMPGYAAGLTRVDMHLGTHLNSNGFHKSPIVFGALPSLHSAMAALGFFFICYHTRWYTPKILMFLFVNLQWWATMYLDHHWRIDLIFGLLYSILSFTLFSFFLVKKEKEFVTYRLDNNFNKSSSFGMRVFKDTRFQKFFDPLQ